MILKAEKYSSLFIYIAALLQKLAFYKTKQNKKIITAFFFNLNNLILFMTEKKDVIKSLDINLQEKVSLDAIHRQEKGVQTPSLNHFLLLPLFKIMWINVVM